MENLVEEWKPIKGHEDNYLVSSHGRIMTTKGKMCHLSRLPHGYMVKSIKNKTYYVHRLVAEAFIPNPDNKLCVDHIDHVRDNNNVDNLRWCSYEENQHNRMPNYRGSSRWKGVSKIKNGKWIVHITVNGRVEHVGTYDNEDMAGRAYNMMAIDVYGDYAVLNNIDGNEMELVDMMRGN